jgi:hypothetical protein
MSKAQRQVGCNHRAGSQHFLDADGSGRHESRFRDIARRCWNDAWDCPRGEANGVNSWGAGIRLIQPCQVQLFLAA